MSNPLHQFEIRPIIEITGGKLDLSFTNSSLFMMAAMVVVLGLISVSIRKAKVVPSRIQSFVEVIYQIIADMLKETIGPKGRKFFPLVFTLFSFILACNLIGIVPYTFTVTSHIAVTFALALLVFFTSMIVAIKNHGLKFFSVFLPSGTPLFLAPLMIVIEIMAYLSRPISLSIRLAANMIAGHVLLKTIAGFVLLMGFWGVIPLLFNVALTGFEIFIAILQAYIFTMLTCIYLNDAVNLH